MGLICFGNRRIEIADERYLFALIGYIHMNPLTHGFVQHPEEWTVSSYKAYLTRKETFIQWNSMIQLFGGMDNFLIYHNSKKADAFANVHDLAC